MPPESNLSSNQSNLSDYILIKSSTFLLDTRIVTRGRYNKENKEEECIQLLSFIISFVDPEFVINLY